MKRILGVCGSPRKGGNAEWMLRKTLDACIRKGFETNIILLSKERIELCDGCLQCEDLKKCHIRDDMQKIYTLMADADAFVFATPAYFDNVTGHLKNFIDRTNLIGDKLAGKIVGILVVGQADETSWQHVADYLQIYCDILKMKVVGKVYGRARNKLEISKDKDVEHQCEELAEKILLLIK